METQRRHIAGKARSDPHCQFSSLAHHLTPAVLKQSLDEMGLKSGLGVDGETVEEARKTFPQWSDALISQVHKKGYRPLPVRRVYIPKPGKTERRPIGIPTVRDRCLQRSVAKILESIYEEDFLFCSFGGRPNRSAHYAVSTLKHQISSHKISWVYEADIKSFFGSLDHDWMMRMLELRLKDPRILTLLRRWMKAGVIEEGAYQESPMGVPQGGSISVLLSNIYLHYALDLWFEKRVKPRLRGEAYLCRYLDDWVLCFQLKEDADRVIPALSQRLKKFSLSLEPSKTTLLPFGRFAKRDCVKKGQKPPTFTFLGFTFYGHHFDAGNYTVCLKVSKKSLAKSVSNLKKVIRKGMHDHVRHQVRKINACLRGFYHYFGVPYNSRRLRWLYQWALKQWKKSLSRRSQNGGLNWKKFRQMVLKYPLAKPLLRVSHRAFVDLACR